jgi:hypothetical protein
MYEFSCCMTLECKLHLSAVQLTNILILSLFIVGHGINIEWYDNHIMYAYNLNTLCE